MNQGALLQQGGNGSSAIDLSGAGDFVTFSNDGEILSTGSTKGGTLATGVLSTGGGLTLQMNDTSEIEMQGGKGQAAIDLSGGGNTVKLGTVGGSDATTIDLTGRSSFGILVKGQTSTTDEIDLSADSQIESATSGFNGSGDVGIEGTGGGTLNVNLSDNAKIAMTGTDSTGIWFKSGTTGTIALSGSSSISTSGDGVGVFLLNPVGGANAIRLDTVSLSGSSSLGTSGNGGSAFLAIGGANGILEDSSNNTITLGDSSSIMTSGDGATLLGIAGANGILAIGNSNTITLTGASNITTEGKGSDLIGVGGANGISIEGTGNAVSIGQSAADTAFIHTEGMGANGISVYTSKATDSNTIGLDGDGSAATIETDGQYANGIVGAGLKFGATLTVDLSDGANILTEGDDANGIWLQNDAGNITLGGYSGVHTLGDDSDGIRADSGGHEIDLSSADDDGVNSFTTSILTEGVGSNGIDIAGGNNTVKLTAGALGSTFVMTLGEGSDAIYLSGGQNEVDLDGGTGGGQADAQTQADDSDAIHLSGGNNTVNLTGDLGTVTVSTTGENSDAIHVSGGDNIVNLDAGSGAINITTTEDDSDAIYAGGGGNTITLSGEDLPVTTEGTDSDAIHAWGGNNTITLSGGAFAWAAGASADAIYASGGGNTLDLSGGGGAQADGENSDAIHVRGGGNTLTLDDFGAYADGPDGIGIEVGHGGGDTITLQDDASVIAAGSGGVGINVRGHSWDDPVAINIGQGTGVESFLGTAIESHGANLDIDVAGTVIGDAADGYDAIDLHWSHHSHITFEDGAIVQGNVTATGPWWAHNTIDFYGTGSYGTDGISDFTISGFRYLNANPGSSWTLDAGGTIEDGKRLEIAGGATFTNNGAIQLSSSYHPWSTNVLIDQGGVLTGNGSYGLVDPTTGDELVRTNIRNYGTFAPTGPTVIDGRYSQEAGSTLVYSIDGAGANTELQIWNHGASVDQDSSLKINEVSGSVPDGVYNVLTLEQPNHTLGFNGFGANNVNVSINGPAAYTVSEVGDSSTQQHIQLSIATPKSFSGQTNAGLDTGLQFFDLLTPQATPSAGGLDLFASAGATQQLAQAGGTSDADPMAPGLPGSGIQAWVRGYGRFVNQDAKDSLHDGYQYNLGGAVLGLQKKLGGNWIVGGGASYGYTGLSTDSATDSNINSYLGGVFLGYAPANGFFANLSAGGGYSHYDIDRVVLNFGTLGINQANTDGYQFGSRLEVGKVFDLPHQWSIRPSASLAYLWVRENAYTETGLSPLTVGDQTASALDLAGQVQVSRAFNVKITGPGNKLIPALGVGVLHQFALNDESIDASFGGGTPFVLPGEKFEQTLALVGAGVTLTMNHGMAAYARYNAELSGDYTAQTVLAGLQFGF